VPAKTPKETIVAIRNAVVAALHTPDVSKRLTEMSSNVIASEPQEFAAFIQSEVDRHRESRRQAPSRARQREVISRRVREVIVAYAGICGRRGDLRPVSA